MYIRGLPLSYPNRKLTMPKFLDRYLAGEHGAVWKELVALGEGIRQKRHYADAAAVAAETMRRARMR